MKAVFTQTFWMEVEDIEEAAALVPEMDKGARIGARATLERSGQNLDELEGKFGYLGASFWVLDEDRVNV